ncbi:TPA: hypothetical protein N0F65_001038 [Lagenidium giganteum]|uniref:Barwin domain-containing protein n=1 Tax=Lagenidium giganteum TaxID=4803 RepID=A0AAV2YN31_9STRA|nr:TPA: hypothetical protein N0F65_001038 [Lagenidium giganteum]
MLTGRSFIITTIATVLLAFHTADAGTASGATYHLYDGVSPSQTTCNIPFGSMMVTAYNALGKDLKCGDCVRVTNKNGGKSAVVKVVDLGGARGFDLSKQAFDAIDNANKDGYAAGHMDIEYEKTACGGGGDVTPAPGPTKAPSPAPTSPTVRPSPSKSPSPPTRTPSVVPSSRPSRSPRHAANSPTPYSSPPSAAPVPSPTTTCTPEPAY